MADKSELTDEVVEALEPSNPRDEVDNDVRAALAQLKGEDAAVDKSADDPEIPEAPVAAEAKEPADKSVAAKERDPNTGKFTAKEAPVKAADKLPPTDTTKVSQEQPSTAAVAPPVSWAADAKSGWAAIPPAIQNAVLKREAEISTGGRQWSEEKRQYETALAPVAELSARYKVPAGEVINRLTRANAWLEKDPASALAWLAQTHGVDLQNLASNPPAQQVRSDPMVPQLHQQVSQLQGQLNGFLQNQTLGVVESFASTHPHYAEVENELLKVIPLVQQENPGSNHNDILQKAYDQAIWLNPDVRAKIIAEQQTAATTAKTTEIQTKSNQAKKAAVSIKGSSNGATAPKGIPAGADVYDDVRNAIASLRN